MFGALTYILLKLNHTFYFLLDNIILSNYKAYDSASIDK